MTELNVVCLKWGSKYSSDYVNKLHSMVSRHLTLKHQFICITDDPRDLHEGIITKPIMQESLQGWWHKLSLFADNAYNLQGTVLFFDLDIVITSNIDDLIHYKPGEFCILRDLQNPHTYNSSVFRLAVGSQTAVWSDFIKRKDDITQTLWGDQDWISEKINTAQIWPQDWVLSYKKQCNARAKHSYGAIGKILRKKGLLQTQGQAQLPNNCKVVIFHGRPNPEDVQDKPYDVWKRAPWIKDHWV